MSNAGQSRRRAVRLVPSAQATLKAEIVAKWIASRQAGKLTREARADYLGVSVATAERIVAGKGVDRASLLHAYKTLGLPWDDAYCEFVQQSPSAPELALETEHAVSQRRSGWPFAVAIVSLALVIATLLAWKKAPPQNLPTVAPPWVSEFNVGYDRAIVLYNQAKYDEARLLLQKLIAVARGHDSAGRIAGALRLAADLDAARGDFSKAREEYHEALIIRRNLRQFDSLPNLYECLGEMETKLGQYPKARDHFMLAFESYRKSNEPVGQALISRDLGTLYSLMKENAVALAWFDRSLRQLDGKDHEAIAVDVRARQALVFRDVGRIDESIRALRACLKYWTDAGHSRWIARTKFQLGTCLVADGNRSSALAMLSQSQSGFAKVGDRAGEAEAMRAIRDLSASVQSHR